MLPLVISLLLKASIVIVVARLIPGIVVASFGSAVLVAAVYALLSVVFKELLVLFSLPLLLVTFGAFMFVINGFLLWLTDKLLSGFEIKSFGSLAMATVAFTFGDILVRMLVNGFFS